MLDLLGHAAGADRVRRLPLRRLSADAVRRLSAGRSVDADRVLSVTSGNPFFVSEVRASGDGSKVPPTIVDAVLARVRRLDPATRDSLEQLAVVPSAIDRRLLDALIPEGPVVLAPAEERGLLAVSPARITFRHELTRRSIVDSLPAARRVELNRRVLAALIEREGADLSRIIHHAAEAGDLAAIARYGPDAARDAARAGAHREAAAHYRLVLQQRNRFAPAQRAELLEGYAIECYTVGTAHVAVAAQREAVELRRALGEPQAIGTALRWLSRMHWWAGERAAAETVADQASAVLTTAGDKRLLALALSNRSRLHMLAHHSADAIEYGERAAALAREIGDAGILTHALTNIGLARWSLGQPAGKSTMDEALRVALDAGLAGDACRAYVGTIWSLLDEFRLNEAERYLAAGLDLAGRAEQLGFLSYLHAEQARFQLARSAWGEAIRAAERAVSAQAPTRCPALTVLGRVRVRRGQAGADELLAQAWDLATEMAELQRIGPVAAAIAEHAWLRGDHAAVRAIAEPVYQQARRFGAVPHEAELGYWLAKAGQPVAEMDSDHPFALLAAGRWRAAAVTWRAAGCPYEHAVALAESTDPADLLAALTELNDLGAEPLATLVRRRLRALESPASRRAGTMPPGQTRLA